MLLFKCLKSPVTYRTPFDSQYIKGSQTLLKSARQHFYYIVSSVWDKLSWKMPLLVLLDMSGLSVNILTADDKYSVLNRENLPQLMEMQLSKNQKAFSKFFVTFLKSRSNFEYFEETSEPHSWCVLKLETGKDVVS